MKGSRLLWFLALVAFLTACAGSPDADESPIQDEAPVPETTEVPEEPEPAEQEIPDTEEIVDDIAEDSQNEVDSGSPVQAEAADAAESDGSSTQIGETDGNRQPVETTEASPPASSVAGDPDAPADPSTSGVDSDPPGTSNLVETSENKDKAWKTGAEDSSPIAVDDLSDSAAPAAENLVLPAEVETGAFNPLLVDDIPYDPAPIDNPGSGEVVATPVLEVDSGTSGEDSGAVLPGSPEMKPDAPGVDQSPVPEVPGNPDPVIDSAPATESSAMVDPAAASAAPSRWMDGPGEFSILLEGQGWVFRSDLSTPGSWRFLARDIDGGATRFSFLFEEPGDWNLVFERQDLSSGGSERVTRGVQVGEGNEATIENGPLRGDTASSIPGTMPSDPAERSAAAEAAVLSGDSAGAIALWEKDAGEDDEAGRAARSAIIEEAVRSSSLVPLVTWIPEYIEDGGDETVLEAAFDLLENSMGYDDTKSLIVDELADRSGSERRPEWLYRQARRLEEPGEGRDLDRSAVLYLEVVEGWPLSEWRDLADERLAFLRRHYFRVR